MLTAIKPIFLRACHSPWTWIPQSTLIWARGVTVAYLTALWPVLINLNLLDEESHDRWSLAFDFSILSYFLLWLYHVIVFVGVPPFHLRHDLLHPWKTRALTVFVSRASVGPIRIAVGPKSTKMTTAGRHVCCEPCLRQCRGRATASGSGSVCSTRPRRSFP